MIDLLPWILLLIAAVVCVCLIGVIVTLRTQLARREWRKEHCEAEFPAKPDDIAKKKPGKKRAKVIPLAGKTGV